MWIAAAAPLKAGMEGAGAGGEKDMLVNVDFGEGLAPFAADGLLAGRGRVGEGVGR